MRHYDQPGPKFVPQLKQGDPVSTPEGNGYIYQGPTIKDLLGGRRGYAVLLQQDTGVVYWFAEGDIEQRKGKNVGIVQPGDLVDGQIPPKRGGVGVPMAGGHLRIGFVDHPKPVIGVHGHEGNPYMVRVKFYDGREGHPFDSAYADVPVVNLVQLAREIEENWGHLVD